MHQSLTKYGKKLRTILPRHEQGGAFAAQGYARSTGKPGVVMATSGPGDTNLVTSIADAKLDSIPLIAITGQVSTSVIGTDAFQETPIVEVCRGITKHHYLVTQIDDLARVMKEAFHIATTGRPGPVLIDMPKNVQMDQCEVPEDVQMNLPGYRGNVPHARPEQIRQIAAAIKHPSARFFIAVVASSLPKRPSVASVGQVDRHSGDDDRYGFRRLSKSRRTVVGHAWHARQRLRQLCGTRLRSIDRPGRTL